MRFPLMGIMLSLLGVACSAPDESAIFEDTGTGGDSSGGITASSSTGSNEGGAGAEASDGGSNSSTSGGSKGATTTTSGGTSTSTSVGGNGAGGSTSGTGTTGAGTGGTGGTAITSSSTSSGGTGGGGCASEEVCDGADNDCNDSVDDDACPNGCLGASFEKHTYLFCDRPGVVGNSEPSRSWQQAQQFCGNRGFLLTLVETEDENAFIYKTLLRHDLRSDAWMGATDQEEEGLWSWATDEDPDEWVAFYDQDAEEPIENAFNDWREGEPNEDGGEDCAIFDELGNDEWAWDDRNCQQEFDLFVCESTD